jgi:5-methyltetrahydrofolate--homocysteine methyltransferase
MNRLFALQSELSAGRAILMDGAMGTELMRAGLQVPAESAASWNLTHPDRVSAVHKAYCDAGASCLVTNTFDLANQPFDFGKLQLLYEAAVRLARNVAGEDRWVFGSFSAPQHLAGDARFCVRQMQWLRGVDAVLLETQTQLDFPTRILDAVSRQKIDLPLIVSFAFVRSKDGSWLGGPDMPESVARWAAAHRHQLLAFGVNCGTTTVDELLHIAKCYREYTTLPLLARPSAGIPVQHGGRFLYPDGPGAMAARVGALLEAGVTMIGGCCGTAPEYIAAFRPVVEAWNARCREQ